MKVSIKKSCCGHARCWVAAPEFYVLDSDGYNAHRGETIEVPPGMEAAAQRGANACPDKVIVVIADGA